LIGDINTVGSISYDDGIQSDEIVKAYMVLFEKQEELVSELTGECMEIF
jgi:hypothetical protein